MIIKNLKQTCEACPSQWDGELDNGQRVYIRYRWGYLNLSVGEKGESVLSYRNIFSKEINQFADGVLTTEELKEHIKEKGITIDENT